jgi:microcystin-dependent protein
VATPYISEIRLFAFGFAPKGWAICQGQSQPINQNQALFSLLGTTYGGDGRTFFLLPDLRGRAALSMGQGAGLQSYQLGQQLGAETVALTAAQMPAHTHTADPTQVTAALPCVSTAANQISPSGNVPAVEAAGLTATYSSAAADSSVGSAGVAAGITASNVGTGTAHNNMQPFITLNYCIALQGIFPSQT